MPKATFKTKIKAINNFFSNKHDLLAIGLFIGASVALMLSELFNWLLNNQVTNVVPFNGFWFMFISFLVLILKFVCIAFVLVGIDRLYNRFVRQPFVQRTTKFKERRMAEKHLSDYQKAEQQIVEQEKNVSAALEESTGFDSKTLDIEAVSSDVRFSNAKLSNISLNQDSSKQGFIVEYLQGHDTEDYGRELKANHSDDLQSFSNSQPELDVFAIKYSMQDKLRSQLDSLTNSSKQDDTDDSLDSIVDVSETSKEEITKSSHEKQLSVKNMNKVFTELQSDKIRSILAKN